MRNRPTVGDDVYIATFNSKNRTVSDEHLTAIFAAVGREYGYEDTEAEFAALTDFKVRWQRSYSWIRFSVSDYLDRAPDDVLQNLAEVLFAKIVGEDRDYDDVFIRYITDPALTRENRKDFLKRSRNLNKTSIGEFHDLNDCVNRLRDAGLIPPDMNCELRWDSSQTPKASGCSVLQRVVWVNKYLDQKGVPEHVLDYCVYAMMAHLIAGFNNRDEREYIRLLQQYPMKIDAEAWLGREGLFI
jgi:hypothetical protein